MASIFGEPASICAHKLGPRGHAADGFPVRNSSTCLTPLKNKMKPTIVREIVMERDIRANGEPELPPIIVNKQSNAKPPQNPANPSTRHIASFLSGNTVFGSDAAITTSLTRRHHTCQSTFS